MAVTIKIKNNTTASSVPVAGTFGAVNEPLYNSTDGILYLKKGDDSVLAVITDQDKAVANGVATLDGSGKIPASQLTVSAMEFKGSYNASTNSPDLTSAYSGSTGDVYIVSVAGTQDLDGTIASTAFALGDEVIWDGSTFVHLPKNTVHLADGIEIDGGSWS